MPDKVKYKIMEGISTADVAYEVYGDTLEDLFSNAAQALVQTMVDMKTVRSTQNFKFQIFSSANKQRNSSLENLLFDFLSEIIFLKDAMNALFSKFKVKIEELGGVDYRLNASLWGEKADIKRHKLKTNVKAITRHKFYFGKKEDGFSARFVLDI